MENVIGIVTGLAFWILTLFFGGEPFTDTAITLILIAGLLALKIAGNQHQHPRSNERSPVSQAEDMQRYSHVQAKPDREHR